MQFSSILIAAVSLALAQAKIGFTTLPSEVQAGKATTLKWTGGEDDQPVTITLKKGESSDLQTVAVLTGDATGNSYTWTPSKSLANGDDYALQISQGVDEINYTGLFSLSGGSNAPASSYSMSSSASSMTSASSSAETTVFSANSTTSLSHTVYMTGTAPLTTGPAPSGASGTGVHVSRNTTFSSATPTRSHSGGLKATTTGAATTSEESSGSSATSSAASASSSGAAAHIEIQVGAGIAAIMGLAALL